MACTGMFVGPGRPVSVSLCKTQVCSTPCSPLPLAAPLIPSLHPSPASLSCTVPTGLPSASTMTKGSRFWSDTGASSVPWAMEDAWGRAVALGERRGIVSIMQLRGHLGCSTPRLPHPSHPHPAGRHVHKMPAAVSAHPQGNDCMAGLGTRPTTVVPACFLESPSCAPPTLRVLTAVTASVKVWGALPRTWACQPRFTMFQSA